MGKARILAVDDQRYFRELIEGLLQDEGYAVETCATGEEALARLEQEDFDIVVTDLVMPGIDGAELVRRIKERLPDQDVVIVTGVVDVKTAVDAMKLGATDYILKPFDRQALADAFARITSQRKLQDEHARLIEENLEFMGVLSLVERASALFSDLSVEPLAERLVEGLCLETRAQSGVIWVAENPGEDRGEGLLELVGARGMVRVDGEPERIALDELEAAWCPGLGRGRSVVAAMPEDVHGVEALYLPLRADGETLGIVRLSDKLDGAAFDARDRAMAEKFCELASIAVANAMRFRALERRSLRDPTTRAYSAAYFADAIRNEIQKASRFGHRFALLRVEIDGLTTHGHEGVAGGEGDEAGDIRFDGELAQVARRLEGALRGSDLLATSEDGAFQVLLPQADALGAGVLAQRIRAAFFALWEGRAPRTVRFAAVTHPVDGTRFEDLQARLAERAIQARESLVARRPELGRRQALEPLFDRLLELGDVLPLAAEGQILRFVLEDVVRRPGERGVLFVSPGVRWLPDALEMLETLRSHPTRTEIVVLSEGEAREALPGVTWVTKSGLDSRRPFVVHFGEGPAFAMVGAVQMTGARTPVFQSADRTLVEHLAFELQRELEITLSV